MAQCRRCYHLLCPPNRRLRYCHCDSLTPNFRRPHAGICLQVVHGCGLLFLTSLLLLLLSLSLLQLSSLSLPLSLRSCQCHYSYRSSFFCFCVYVVALAVVVVVVTLPLLLTEQLLHRSNCRFVVVGACCFWDIICRVRSPVSPMRQCIAGSDVPAPYGGSSCFLINRRVNGCHFNTSRCRTIRHSNSTQAHRAASNRITLATLIPSFRCCCLCFSGSFCCHLYPQPFAWSVRPSLASPLWLISGSDFSH